MYPWVWQHTRACAQHGHSRRIYFFFVFFELYISRFLISFFVSSYSYISSTLTSSNYVHLVPYILFIYSSSPWNYIFHIFFISIYFLLFASFDFDICHISQSPYILFDFIEIYYKNLHLHLHFLHLHIFFMFVFSELWDSRFRVFLWITKHVSFRFVCVKKFIRIC